jgi:hypothetical protein
LENLCCFREYCKEKAHISHTRFAVEERLVENEIGGVILGSLTAGLKMEPLSRDEYLKEIRSNITNKTEEGLHRRRDVYDVFEDYQKWKYQRKTNTHDVNDVVLMLLKEPISEIFDSGKARPAFRALFTFCLAHRYLSHLIKSMLTNAKTSLMHRYF